jgi:DNA-binding NarL/FixJ family response regulator
MSPRSRVPGPNEKPRVLVAEEETLVRDALRLLLEREFHVVGAVPDFDALRRTSVRLRPDVVVAAMPLFAGRARPEMRALRNALPDGGLVILAREAAKPNAIAAALGAARWVLRSSTVGELLAAVRAAARCLPSPPAALVSDTITSLRVTPRAAEVVRLIAGGKVMKEVAADLGISARTVAFHKYKTMRELGLDSTAALVRYAVRNQLV